MSLQTLKVYKKNFVDENPKFGQTGPARGGFLGYVLGTLLGIGITTAYYCTSMRELGLFFSFVTFFHLNEYLTTALFRPINLSYHSFLFDHKRYYTVSIGVSIIEYFIEVFFFPWIKSSNFTILIWIGCCIAIIGQVVRLISLIPSQTNTNGENVIPNKGIPFIKDGIYKYCRHPGYAGWFWWIIGTQIVLLNPVCLLGSTFVYWYYFKAKIEQDEKILFTEFEEYPSYKQKVRISLINYILMVLLYRDESGNSYISNYHPY